MMQTKNTIYLLGDDAPQSVSPQSSDGDQLSCCDDLQGDASEHLVSRLPSCFPQLKLLWVGGVVRRPGQHHLAHELILYCVTVPHLTKVPDSHVWVSYCCHDNGSCGLIWALIKLLAERILRMKATLPAAFWTAPFHQCRVWPLKLPSVPFLPPQLWAFWASSYKKRRWSWTPVARCPSWRWIWLTAPRSRW